MLSELKKVEDKPVPETAEKDPGLEHFDDELCGLGRHLEFDNVANFEYRGKPLVLKGIPEDFDIILNKQLVCECVYGTCQTVDLSLVKELIL